MLDLCAHYIFLRYRENSKKKVLYHVIFVLDFNHVFLCTFLALNVKKIKSKIVTVIKLISSEEKICKF